MAMPPRVTAEDAAAAIERIAERRGRIDDANAWRLGDDPADVLEYLRRHSSGIPLSIRKLDILDGLVLKTRLWWIAEDAECWLLERAHEMQLSSGQLRPVLGVSSRQGVLDRLRSARRKAARLRGEDGNVRPSPSTSESRRRVEQELWIGRHRVEVRSIASAAVDFIPIVDSETAEWLVDVRRDLTDDVLSVGGLQLLRFALADLSTDDGPGLHGRGTECAVLLARWSDLYGSYPSG